MPIMQLDHVNIRTNRLAACVEFYGNVLGLTMTPPPMAPDMALGAYGRDDGAPPSSTSSPPTWWSKAPIRSGVRRNAA